MNRILLLCLAVAGASCAYYFFNGSDLDLKKVSASIIQWIEEQGDLAPIFYVFFLAIWVVLLLPCSVLEVVPGFLFGFKTGWIVAVFGKTLGTWLSLLIGRYLVKDSINKYIVEKYPMVQAFNKAVEQEGFQVIMMIRVTYLPMLIKNYGLAVLDIPIWKILVASMGAGIPFAAGWAAIGAASTNIGEILAGKMKMTDALPDENRGLIIGGGIVGAIAFAYTIASFGKRFKLILAEVKEKEE